MIKSLFSKLIGKRREEKDLPPPQSPIVDIIWPSAFKGSKPFRYQNFTDLVQVYGSLDYLFACINLLGSSIRQFDLEILEKDSKGILKNVEGSFAENLLKYPNKKYGFKTLLEGTAISLAITGNAYWEIVKVKGRTVGIYILQPHRIVIKRNQKTNRIVYEYQTGHWNKPIVYSEDEIIHFKLINLQDDFYGLSPLVAAQLPASVAKKAMEMLDSYFENGGIFKGVLETDKLLPSNVYEQLKARLAEMYQGFKNAFKIPILEGGLKYKQIQVHPKDSQALEANEQAMLKILSIFRVPPELLGLRQVNRLALEELRRLYWEDAVKPFASKIEETLNIQKYKFLPKEEQDYIIHLDYSNIEALKGNELSRARIAAMLVDRGILTLNEARERFFNLKPLPFGDMVLLPLNMLQIDADRRPENLPGGQGGNALSMEIPSTKYIAIPIKETEEKSIVLNTKKEIDLVRESLSKTIAYDIQDLFLAQFTDFVKKLDIFNFEQESKDVVKVKIKKYFDGVSAIFEDKIYKLLLNRLNNIAFSIAWKAGHEKLPDKVYANLDEFAFKFSKTLALWLNKTTKKRIIEIIERYSDNPTELKIKISKEFEKAILPESGTRLKTIAKTESNRILNFVMFIIHKYLGYKYKTWHCFDCEHSRHKDLSMKKISIDEVFDVNGEEALFPCAPTLSANNSTNCRCFLIYSQE